MVVLDVREPIEYATGHVKNAKNHSVSLMQRGMLPEIPKDVQIVTYCRSGARSELARQILLANGYTDVTNGGGLSDMLRVGYSVN